MTEHDTHKTIDGGSIDYAHYIERGRTLRSETAWSALAKLRPQRRAANKTTLKTAALRLNLSAARTPA